MSLSIWLAVPVDVGNPEVREVSIGSDHGYTHNVAPMWELAGCHKALYGSDGNRAEEILPILRTALAHMQDNPAAHRELNPTNNWGEYETAMEFLAGLIADCAKYPKAIVRVSR